MPALKDLTSQRFGRLFVKGRANENSGQRVTWECRCDCGIVSCVAGNNLTSGHTQSCGCLSSESRLNIPLIHGHSRRGETTPTYRTWANMKTRCDNPNNKFYRYYGGRGITYCPEWSLFENFLKDMGVRPDGKTIERKNNELGYYLGNCCWAGRRQQNRNTRNNHRLSHNGVTLCISEWADKLDINPMIISTRLHRGWSVGRALTQPVERC